MNLPKSMILWELRDFDDVIEQYGNYLIFNKLASVATSQLIVEFNQYSN